jgi:nicotinamidase-related amidase
MKNREALLIIDMQKGCFTEESPKFDSDGVIERINLLAQKFRDLDAPVIFIQQDSSKWNRLIPNTSEWEILSNLQVGNNDISINKTANDAFYQSNLHSLLNDLKIKEIFITGFATEFCVDATIQSALIKDFDITVVKNGHTTGDKLHITAKQIIEHHNWVWQNMIPTKGRIKVVNYEELEITTTKT